MSHVKFISRLNLFYIKEYLITRYYRMGHSYHCKERENNGKLLQKEEDQRVNGVQIVILRLRSYSWLY